MIQLIADTEIGVRDKLTRFGVVFVAVLFDWFVLGVGSMKDFVYDRDDELRHSFQHRAKHIVKYCMIISHKYLLYPNYNRKFPQGKEKSVYTFITLSGQRDTRSEKSQFLPLLRCFPSTYVRYAD